MKNGLGPVFFKSSLKREKKRLEKETVRELFYIYIFAFRVVLYFTGTLEHKLRTYIYFSCFPFE